MNKNKISTLLLAILVILASATSVLVYREFVERDYGAGARQQLRVASLNGNNASSSVTYLSTLDTASTTWSFACSQASAIDLNLQYTASSSNSKLEWRYEFSMDNIDWFREDTKSTAGAVVTHTAATTTHSWTPGSAEVHRKNITITPTQANYMRIIIGSIVDSGSLWGQAVINESY